MWAKQKRHSGFTIVELLIVIVIIGILATIATVSFNKITAESRDSQRVADVTTISESLEAYFMKNGEYPSCAVINSSASTITALSPNVVKDTLTAPNAKTKGTSLACGSGLVLPSGGDKYVYVGDGSQICNTGSSCGSWKIEYWNEVENTVATVMSRHQSEATNVPVPDTSVASMTYAAGVVKGTPSGVSCNTGKPQYSLRSRLNNGTWTAYTSYSFARTPLSVSAAQGDKTDYQVQTRCYLTAEYISGTTAGPAATFIVPIAAPNAPVVAVDAGAPNAANWTWTTNACSGGLTPSFRYAWAKDDATGWRAWSSATTATANSQNTTDQGYNYQLKAQQRCNSAYANGAWSNDSNVSSYLRSIDTPAAPSSYTYTSSSPSSNGYTQSTMNISWNESSCGSGTAKRLNLAVAYYVSASVPPNASAYTGGTGKYTPIWSDNANTQTNWKASNPGSYLSSYYSNASSVTSSDLSNTSGNFGLNSNNDNPAWLDWTVNGSNPLTISSGNWSSSKQNTKFTFVRIYARNACFNTVTQRAAVGGYSFSPAWSWSGY